MAEGTAPPSPPPAEDTLVAIRAILESMYSELSREFAELEPRLESIDGRLASIDKQLNRLYKLDKLDSIEYLLKDITKICAASKS